MIPIRRAAAFLVFAGIAAVRLSATPPGVSYAGTFSRDDDKREFFFTLSAPGIVTLRTLSYAGGVNSAGTAIPGGGFDPTISVFDSSGNLIAWNGDGGCGNANVAADAVPSFCWDSLLQLPLPAGNYSAVLTQSENLPNGPTLADSFVYDGQGNFTAAPGVASPGFFRDFILNQRTGSYAVDIVGASASQTTTITSSATLPSGVTGQPYRFTFTAQSGPGATLTWLVASGSVLPPGLTLNASTGVLSGNPSATGNFSFTVQVSDGVQTVAQAVTVAIFNPPPITIPPTITTTSLPTGAVNQSYGPVAIRAAGGSGFGTWSGSGLPANLTISSGGLISGTPATGGLFSVQVTFTDSSSGQSASATLQLTISFPALQITSSGALGGFAAGTSASSTPAAIGGKTPYTWSATGLPSGFNFNASTGAFSGAAPAPGTYSFTLTVSDSQSPPATATTTVSMSFSVLGITTSGGGSGSTTAAYSQTFSAIGGTPPYSFSGSGIPAGLSLSSSGLLSGQPQAAGTYTIGVQVTDSRGVTVSGNFSFTITGPAPTVLTIIITSLPDGFVGQPYSQSPGASGGSPGYTWSQSGGQMPAGLSLSGGGNVAGTPTTPGSYTIGMRVSDTSGAQVVGTVAINIQPAPLQITSGATLPSGQVGVGYPSQILTAAGGTPPYTFSIRGSLPAGLTLSNGQIGGTPSAVGDFAFTLVATDSAVPTPVTATLGVSGTIKPNVPDLILSSATASFALTSGTSAVPLPDTISVSSSFVAQILAFTTSSSVPWVTVGGSASTPGSITVGPNSAALALSSTGSPYAGTVTVTCTSPSCTGKSQAITVSLTVTAAPPQLSLGSPLLSFVALTSDPQPSSAALSIVNAGGGSLAIQSVSAADGWISVGAFPATVTPGPGGSVTITANPAGRNPGYYLSSVTVASSAGSASIPVTLLIAGSGVMTLGPAGTQFSMPLGEALGNASGSFLVSVSSGNVSFNASVLPGAAWLSGGGPGSASAASPGTVSFSIDQTAAAALGVGAYYATIRVSSSGIVDSPQDFQVVLNISPAATGAIPDPQPAGLVFISSGAALPPQTVQLFASLKNAIAFQVSPSMIDGSGWLSISPAIGSTSAGSPANVTVTASPAGLRPGVYRGTVSFAFASAVPVRTVNVTLIVQAALTGASSPAQALPAPAISSSGTPGGRLAQLATPACAGAQLVPTQTGLVSNFSAPASWPTPLAIRLVDTCGSAIGGAQIVTTFSNGDPPLVLSATDTASGLYSGTWTPRKASSQVTILARASVPGYTTATTQIAGQVAPNTVPVLAPNGTFDIFHPQVGAGLGPGNIVQIYGSGLAGQIGSPTVLPLPVEVNGTSVLIGGLTAPLYYVSPGQINAQIPFELTAGNQYQVIVSSNGALTTPQPIQLTAAVPAILQFTSGAVVAQHRDGTLILDSSPATPGEYVVIYLTGLGATDIPVPSGTASPSSPLAHVVDTPVLTINGTSIPVLFAGLTPTLVGLYQIDFQVPQTLASGNYELLISQSGTVSNQTILAVKQ